MADKKYANEHPRNKKKDKSPTTRAEKMANYKALSNLGITQRNYLHF